MKTSICKINFKSNNLYTILSISISVILWQVISQWLNKPIIIPTPNETLISLIKIIKHPMCPMSLVCLFPNYNYTKKIAKLAEEKVPVLWYRDTAT